MGWLSEFTWRRVVRRPLTAKLAVSRGPCPELLHWHQLLPLGTGALGMDQRVSGRVDQGRAVTRTILAEAWITDIKRSLDVVLHVDIGGISCLPVSVRDSLPHRELLRISENLHFLVHCNDCSLMQIRFAAACAVTKTSFTGRPW